jgi:hypothetical protein
VNQAQYKLVASLGSGRIESSLGSLLFDANGKLQHADGAPVIRLPLSESSPGPVFTLEIDRSIDDGGNFNADYEEINHPPGGLPTVYRTPLAF